MTIKELKKYLEEFGNNEDLEITFTFLDKTHNIVMPNENIEDTFFIKDDALDHPAILFGGRVIDMDDDKFFNDLDENNEE